MTTADLARFGTIHGGAVRVEWELARHAGLDIRIMESDGLLLGAAPSIDSRAFNRALGTAERPDRIPEALAFFAEHGVAGVVSLDPADVPPGVEPATRLEAYIASPPEVSPIAVDGLEIRTVSDESASLWTDIILASYQPDPDTAAVWRAMSLHVASTSGRRLLLGYIDGRTVAAGSIQLTDAGAWISWAAVIPEARGRGIQRAMIAARARLAEELGCEWIAAWALSGEHSSANLARAGLRRIGERASVRSVELVAADRLP
jgi:GNAT superfamily N-acetyltransferase